MVSADGQDIDAFLDSVSEVSRLIDGLKAGSITPEYVDNKIAQRSQPKPHKEQPNPAAQQSKKPAEAAADKDAAAAKQAELLRKVEELKASRQRKIKAREQYQRYLQGTKQQQHSYATDYNRWELWCPSDEEDDLFNSLTPNSPQFRAMEQDISKRHARMVEQRQRAERQRQLGNEAFKAGQYSEALRCYEQGLEAQRHDMTLHANAAMAALKLKCYVAAQEHCDKVLHVAEVLHNTPKHPLCVKALQRRAAAYQGLGQHSKAVEDLQAAADILPGDAEILEQLKRAKAMQHEHKTAKQLTRLVAADNKQQGDSQSEQASASITSSAAATDLSSDDSGSTGSSSTARRGKLASEQLSNAVSSSGGDGSSDEVVHLQRIKQCVSETATNTSRCCSSDIAAEARACKELQGLLQEPRHRIFFRQCGGLEAVSQLVNKPPVGGTQPSLTLITLALRVLHAACDADTALEQLADQTLGAILDNIASAHAAQNTVHNSSIIAAPTQAPTQGAAGDMLLAAVELAYAASTCSAVRSRLCAQLIKPVQQQQKCAGDKQGSSRLEGLWAVCCSANGANDTAGAGRVVAISLLSNCMLVATVRNATLPLLQRDSQTLADLTALLSCCPPSTAVKVFGLLSNICNHTCLRAQLAACQPLMQQLMQAAAAATAQQGTAQGPELGLAAVGCLCNLSLEQGVQQMLAADGVLMGQLLQRAAAGPAQFLGGGSGSSSRTRSAGQQLSAGPKLPPRGKANGAAQDTAAAVDASQPATANTCLLSARAATLLSRVARQAGEVQQLQQRGVLSLFAGGVPDCLTALQGKAAVQPQPAQEEQHQGAQAVEVAEAVREWLSAAVRTLALITAAPEACSSCSADTAAAVIAACCKLLQDPNPGDAVKGNAALVLKSFAADGVQGWHAALCKADAVDALVTAARAGKGKPSSKNAGIALAVLARAGDVFVERLRELRGLEVLYEYVRP